MKLSPADEHILKYLRKQVDRLQDERYRTDARKGIANEIYAAQQELKRFTAELRSRKDTISNGQHDRNFHQAIRTTTFRVRDSSNVEDEKRARGLQKTNPQRKTKAPMIRTKARELKTPTKINEYNYKWPKRASQMAQRINRMLCVQVMIKDIAYIEGVTEGVVMAQIDKWNLPREK